MPTIPKPIRTSRVPVGGYVIYVDPDSGFLFKNPLYNEIKRAARKHRITNGYPIGVNWDEDFDRNICSHTPEYCADTSPQALTINRSFGIRDFLRGTLTLGTHWLSGSPVVSEEEANRRAGICSTCHFNQSYEGQCQGVCRELRELAAKMVGVRKTKYDNQIKKTACKICQCATEVQINIPLDILRSTVTTEMDELWPEWCWKKPL